jgi:hypothetical protein
LTPGLRQIAQDLRGLFYDGTKPFESLARLLAERGSAAVAAVGPIGIRVADDRATNAFLLSAMALASSTGYAVM